jgi:hypothetical protein
MLFGGSHVVHLLIMSFIPSHQWYVEEKRDPLFFALTRMNDNHCLECCTPKRYGYYRVSQAWKRSLDQPYSYQFLKRFGIMRHRYQELERITNEAKSIDWKDGYDQGHDVMCANGCCYSTNHNDERNDESDEDSDDEPFTNDDTGEVDQKAALRWSLQRGSTIWYVTRPCLALFYFFPSFSSISIPVSRCGYCDW